MLRGLIALPLAIGNPSGKLQELLHQTEEEIISWVRHEHEIHFPKDSKVKNDPVIISVNAYNLTMHFCTHLMQDIMKRCVDMQARTENNNVG